MKLRLAGASLRVRLSAAELEQLASVGRVVSDTRFGSDAEARLRLVVELSEGAARVEAELAAAELRVRLPAARGRAWLAGEETGLYARQPAGASTLKIAVERELPPAGRSG